MNRSSRYLLSVFGKCDRNCMFPCVPSKVGVAKKSYTAAESIWEDQLKLARMALNPKATSSILKVTGHSNILRKNPHHQLKLSTEKRDDLLVFGYACKLFRDDEKASRIDKGEHLIPWMGDESLKIDRYDVRATLNNLTIYEAPAGGFDNRLEHLSPDEQRAEQLCEEERYYSLIHCEIEEELYEEEKLKRLHQERSNTYGQVAFNYNENAATITEAEPNESQTEEDNNEPYIKPDYLVIPERIIVPETMKQHTIIEKTAEFISQQGLQMEILIKAKQANNPQFEFLNQKDNLNMYYKLMLDVVKSKAYIDAKTKPTQIDIVETNEPIVIPPVPAVQIKYKPSEDCSYTQLISKIKGVPITTLQSVANETNKETDMVATTVESKKPTGLLLSHYYSSGSESDEDDNDDNQSKTSVAYKVPPLELKNIIDKTAAYVVKNGKEFENTLRAKADARFSFLDSNNEYYNYYIHKIGPISSNGATSNTNNLKRPIDTPEEKVVPVKIKPILPVSFSIKAKEEVTITIKPVLSSEDEDGESSDIKETTSKVITDIAHDELESAYHRQNDKEQKERLEAKRAEEKAKDRIAIQARGKLSSLSKEKQLERKRKAIAFLNQINSQRIDLPPVERNEKVINIPPTYEPSHLYETRLPVTLPMPNEQRNNLQIEQNKSDIVDINCMRYGRKGSYQRQKSKIVRSKRRYQSRSQFAPKRYIKPLSSEELKRAINEKLTEKPESFVTQVDKK